ncbi:MAG: efflux RND transporter periplasmic adaptor subunit [Legionellaceae bacterium]|nr:efflux RND transporter periplasmic adaptor subunit [Legionellaceae bacterium]
MTKHSLLRKRMVIMIIALALVFGGILGWNIFKGIMIDRFLASYQPKAVSISTVTATQGNWYPTLSSVGTFLAVNGVDVNAETAGNIVKIFFQSGEYIEEGQPLIVIDDSILQTQLKFNQAELDLKELNYKRQENLYKRGAAPISNVDEAKAQLQQAQANVEQTQAEIRQKHIRAPFSGRLGIRLVNLGQYITPGQTAIVSLQSLDPLYIDFFLPEQYLKDIAVDQNIYVDIEEYPHLQFKGVISSINSKVDPNTHNIRVQASMPNCSAGALREPEGSQLLEVLQVPGASKTTILCNTQNNHEQKIVDYAFIPGMFAAINIEQKTIPNQIILPSTAISYSLYGNSVYLVVEDEEGKKDAEGKPLLRAKRVFVKTGEQQGNYTRIIEGIKAGDQVVSAGEIKLQEGTAVQINNSVQLPDIQNIDSLGQ